MGFAKPIEQYLFGNLLTEIHVFVYLKELYEEVSIYFVANEPLARSL